jgi:hypothetical protein
VTLGRNFEHYRSVESLSWCPAPGHQLSHWSRDSSKATVLEAIDACLTVLRARAFSDTDFQTLDVSQLVDIRVLRCRPLLCRILKPLEVRLGN